MRKVAFVGDCHAILDREDIISWGIHGLPIWDIELKQKVDEILKYDDIERIYLSCGHPFMGCEKNEVFGLSDGEFLTYSQEERGFYGKGLYAELTHNEVEGLCDKYLEYLLLFVSLDERIKLAPITILWHEKIRRTKLNIRPIYDEIKETFPLLHVEVLLTSKFDFKNRFGHLHQASIDKIVGML